MFVCISIYIFLNISRLILVRYVSKEMLLICYLQSPSLYYQVKVMSINQSKCSWFSVQIDLFFVLGNIRRFRRICEHIQSQVCSKRFPGPSSPPNIPTVTQAVSESSSCGSDSSERLCYKRQVRF